MKAEVGVVLPQFVGDPWRLVAAACLAEELGFASCWVFDHLHRPGDATRPILEPFTSLAAAARRTARITLGILVARAGLRPAPALARASLTLAWASGGRFILGLGSGDAESAREEFAHGIRGRNLRERREELLRNLEYLRDHAAQVPLWVGGRSRWSLEVASRLALGWNTWDLPPEVAKGVLGGVQDLPTGFVLSWGGGISLLPQGGGEVGEGGGEGSVKEKLRRLQRLGFSHFVLATLGKGRTDQWALLKALLGC